MKFFSSLLDLRGFDKKKFEDFFTAVKDIHHSQGALSFSKGQLPWRTVALLFFEPSTRTRMSFEAAAYRCGVGPLIFDGGINTSLEKGETIEDSILNIAAMRPDVMVIRCGDAVNLLELSSQIQAPVINAGWGIKGHPTQALLDAVTVRQNFGVLTGKKLLLIGDIKHSRVAASHLELMPQLGVEVSLCGPSEFMPPESALFGEKNIQYFSKLDEALEWADVAMALRVQFERHSGKLVLTSEQYFSEYGLTNKKLKRLKQDGLVMHPGPINYGIEMAHEVLSDPRTKVLEQVSTGVYVREALLRGIINGK